MLIKINFNTMAPLIMIINGRTAEKNEGKKKKRCIILQSLLEFSQFTKSVKVVLYVMYIIVTIKILKISRIRV